MDRNGNYDRGTKSDKCEPTAVEPWVIKVKFEVKIN